MLEAEMWTEKLDDLLDAVEDMLRTLVQRLSETALMSEMVAAKKRTDPLDIEGTHTLDDMEERWRGLLRSPWPRISYSRAIKYLQNAVSSGDVVFEYDVVWYEGLKTEHERYIAACIGQGSPVFVTDYPSSIKPFYMAPSSSDKSDPENPRQTAACFDLLLPNGVEVVGGSLREHRFELLAEKMKRRGFPAPPTIDGTEIENVEQVESVISGDLNWYLDLRRYGTIPHGGFGMGFDRLLGYLAGVHNIRDVITWPRHLGRCDG